MKNSPTTLKKNSITVLPAAIRKIFNKLSNTSPKFITVRDRAYSIINHPLIVKALDDFLQTSVAPMDADNFELHKLQNMPTLRLDQIVIDETLQRGLDIDNIVKIISKFDPRKVSPVKVVEQMFEESDSTAYDEDHYLNYDSQHTVVGSWLMMQAVYGETAANAILFPALILEKEDREFVREDFLMHNDPKRKYSTPCNAQELHEQYVMMSRVDGSTDPVATQHEKIQTLFEEFNVAFIFTKSKKFKDILLNTTSRINEFLHYSEKVQRLFLTYHAKRVELGNKDGMQPKEQVVMFAIINALVEKNDPELISENMIETITLMFNNLWGNDYRPTGPFWKQVKHFYRSYPNDYKQEASQAYNYITEAHWTKEFSEKVGIVL